MRAATYDVILRINSALGKGIPFLLWPFGLDFRQRQTKLVSMESCESQGSESGFTFLLGRPDPEIFDKEGFLAFHGLPALIFVRDKQNWYLWNAVNLRVQNLVLLFS